jgi:hypothetical protein
MLVRLFRNLHQSSVAIPRILVQTRLMSSTANQNPVADEQPSIPHFTFSEEPLGLPASKALATFRVARDSHSVLPIALSFKQNWDLVQRRASGSLVTACKVLDFLSLATP